MVTSGHCWIKHNFSPSITQVTPLYPPSLTHTRQDLAYEARLRVLPQFKHQMAVGIVEIDTLWLFNIAMEAMAHINRWFTWVYPLKMVIFHCYVK